MINNKIKSFIMIMAFLPTFAGFFSSCSDVEGTSELNNDPVYEWPQGKKFYYAFDEKIFLDKVENKVVLSFDEKYLSEIKENFQKSIHIEHMDLFTENKYCTLTTSENTDIRSLMNDIKKLAGVKSVNPLYAVSGLEMAVTDEFVVQFKENASQQAIDALRNKYQIEIREISDLFIILSVPVKYSALEVANIYQESGLTNFSNPSFISQLNLSPAPKFVTAISDASIN